MLTVHEVPDRVFVCLELPRARSFGSFEVSEYTCLFDLVRLLPLLASGAVLTAYANRRHPLNGSDPTDLRWVGRVPGPEALPRLVMAPALDRAPWQVLA